MADRWRGNRLCGRRRVRRASNEQRLGVGKMGAPFSSQLRTAVANEYHR